MFERSLAQIPYPEEPRTLYAPIEYSLSEGGKRMRPVLLGLAFNLYSDELDKAIDAAKAIEVFHNFTLLHDDIMDNAMVRRGRPSVYAKWGENVAILSGDAMLISAYQHLCSVPAQVLPKVLDRFSSMALEICEGQQYDMDFESKSDVSEEDYMHMIELKTSALLRGATTIGAIIAGAPESDVQKLYRFSTELGLAFQLQDDLLDSYGDERLGKKIGGDILEGKKTMLMISALSKADQRQQKVLRETHLRKDISNEEKIAAVKQVYDELDIPKTMDVLINLRISKAVSILDTLSVEASRTEQLKAYANSLLGRKM